jgi:osmotically-inducible protein OsmY
MARSSKRKRSGLVTLPRLVIVAGTAAAVAYLFDPALGRTRRAKLSDQIGAFFRRGVRTAQKKAEYVSSQAAGTAQKVAHGARSEDVPPNDQALTDKVKSEALGVVPTGKIAVNSEGGVVVLRGEVDSLEEIGDIEQRVRKVTGVLDVNNLLHLPGQPPPNK